LPAVICVGTVGVWYIYVAFLIFKLRFLRKKNWFKNGGTS